MMAFMPARAQEELLLEDPATAAPSLPAPTSETAAEMTAEQRYRRGKNLYEYGDCATSVEALAPLAVPGQLQDDRAQLDVHLMLGVCYVLAGKQLEATRELSSVLSIDPDYTLDPFLTPPAAIEVYERQKAAMKVQLEEIRRVREQARAAGFGEEGGVLVERVTTVREVPLATAFMPFGLAQAANGDNVRAVVLGVLQGAFAVTTVAAFWTSYGYGSAPIETDNEKNAYNVAVVVHLLSALGLAGVYGYGVADALWSREDRQVVDRQQSRRALTASEISRLKKIAPADRNAPATTP